MTIPVPVSERGKEERNDERLQGVSLREVGNGGLGVVGVRFWGTFGNHSGFRGINHFGYAFCCALGGLLCIPFEITP